MSKFYATLNAAIVVVFIAPIVMAVAHVMVTL